MSVIGNNGSESMGKRYEEIRFKHGCKRVKAFTKAMRLGISCKPIVRRTFVKTKIEKYLVEQCAPTLAGIKVGSVFYYTAEKGEDLSETTRLWSNRLLGKGVLLCCIRESTDGGLIYVFRPPMLLELLSNDAVKGFLSCNGYAGCDDLDTYIHRLQNRLCDEPRFPHEIGVFLGYPLHDVQGFIKNKGRNFYLCGPWKVYDEQPRAERLFAQYKKCRSIYKAMFENGSTVLMLTVSVWNYPYSIQKGLSS